MDEIAIVNSNKEENHQSASQKETDGAHPESGDNSEYDSADANSYSDDDNVKVRSRASDNEENSEEGSVILEREEGDGQESVPNKKIDDDEDKKNPQYIPKRGTFYEHDDRTLEDTEESKEEEPEKDKDGKKKVWQDKKDKWSHDRFNETEQTPKSRAELVSIYGYDIRNEEGPPRARRRRKYGRGPNKYTRNWEDEDAYNKPTPVVKRGGKKSSPNRNIEEFPPLVTNEKIQIEEDLQSRKEQQKEKPSNSSSENLLNNANNIQSRIGSGRINASNSKKELNESDYNGYTAKTWNLRNTKITQPKVLPPNKTTARRHNKDDYIQSQNFYLSNKNNQDLEKDMSKLNLEDGNKSNSNKGTFNNNNNISGRQSSVPPRLQSEQKGSKRYSSIRQKSLPETNTPPLANYQHATTFYPNEYNQQSVPPTNQQQPQLLHQTTPLTQVAHVAPLQPTQVPVTAAPLLQAAPFAPPPYPQPPPYIQPTPSAFLPPPPQTTQLINFVQGQAAFQPNYQGYQQPFSSVNQATELYQPQGGITYYSADAQLAQRQVPQKRPKAAIPIVAPPSNEKRDDEIEPNEIESAQQ